MLADDDPGLLEALAETIRSAPDLELVGRAADAGEAVQVASTTNPDVVLMDSRMPGGGGVAAARLLAERMPNVRLVALSAHEDTSTALDMVEAGAVGYIVKGVPETEIIEAIRRAYRGQMSIAVELGQTLLQALQREIRELKAAEDQLRQSEKRGMVILESVPDAVVIVGDGGMIELVNEQAEKLFDYRRGELVGQPLEVLVPDRYRHVHQHMRAKVEGERYARPMETGRHFNARRKDGSEFPVDISLSPLVEDGKQKTIAAIRDVTSRSITEEAQRKSEQLFRGLLDSAPDGMVIVDVSGLVQVVNLQAERLFGYSRMELRGQPIEMLLPERFRAAHLRHRFGYFGRPQARPMGANLDLFGRRKDGSEFPVDISLSPMESEGGLLVIAAVRDLTDRQEAKRKLDESEAIQQRQRLFARLVGAQEEERLRIASDIHDDTIQAMTATSLRMQQLRRHLTDPTQIEMLTRLEDAVRESITRLRRLMFDLRPATLDRSGLAAAMRDLLERLEAETDIKFELENHTEAEPDGEVRTALYRIAQEALANVKKHSGAKSVHVDIRTLSNGCRVRIADNGHGFDVEGSESKPGHLGLVSMRERAQIAGGWCSIKSPPGQGTVVEFWLPLPKESTAAPS